MFQEYDDSSSDDDEMQCVPPVTCVYVPPPMEPFDKHQGFFLANLAKMLDEAHVLRIEFAIRWHESIPNALQVSWTSFVDRHYARRISVQEPLHPSAAGSSRQQCTLSAYLVFSFAGGIIMLMEECGWSSR